MDLLSESERFLCLRLLCLSGNGGADAALSSAGLSLGRLLLSLLLFGSGLNLVLFLKLLELLETFVGHLLFGLLLLCSILPGLFLVEPGAVLEHLLNLLCVGILAALGLAGCGSSADDAVKAPVTVTAPATTVTVTATGTGRSAATVSVTETATVTESVSGSGGTVTETVTESADPVESSTATAQSSPTGLKVGAGVTATDDDGVAAITVVSAQRKTTGTGRMRYPKDVSRRFKDGLRYVDFLD